MATVIYEIPNFAYPVRGGKQKAVSLILAREGAVGVVIAFDKWTEELLPSLTNSIESLYSEILRKVKEGATVILVEAGRALEREGKADYSLVRLDATGKPYWTPLGHYHIPPLEEELIEIVERAKERYFGEAPKVQSGSLSENLTEIERLRKRLGLEG